MNRALSVALAIAACCASCAAPERSSPSSNTDASPSSSSDPRTASNDASGALEHAAAPRPLTEAKQFRVETMMFDCPLAIAEDLYGRAGENDSTIGTPVDESRCREALELLAPTNGAIVRSARPDLVLAPRELAYIAPRSASSEHPKDSLASDHLEIQVRAAPSDSWPPLEVETRLRWTDLHGRVLGRLPSGASLVPEGEWIEIACLPSRQDAERERTSAVLAFVHVVPIY